VDDYRQWLARVPGRGADEEALAIPCRLIGTEAGISDGQWKQFARVGRLHRVHSQFQVDYHQLVFRPYVEKFVPARSPLRKSTTTGRNLKDAARLWKSLDVNFIAAGRVRLIRYPTRRRFRREPARSLIERRPQKELGRCDRSKSSLGRHGNSPQVPTI